MGIITESMYVDNDMAKKGYYRFNKEYWYMTIYKPENFDVKRIFVKLIYTVSGAEKFVRAKVICKLKLKKKWR